MNTSQFMDKQIQGLSASQPVGSVGGGRREIFDLINPQEEHRINGGGGEGGGEGVRKEEVLPSYDFQPMRAVGSSPPSSAIGLDGFDGHNPSWASVDSKMASTNLKNAGILEPHVLTKVSHEEERTTYNASTVAEIDRTMKKYTDNLIHALEGVSSRLSQLESRTHHLESSVDELKVAIGNYSGGTDGKLRQFENVLREVQAGVQLLRDKQEIVEAQLQLAKLQTSKGDTQPSDGPSTGQPDSQQHQMPPPQQTLQPQHQTPAPPPSQPNMLPALPAPNAPPPLPLLQNPPPSQFPGQSAQPQIPSVPSLPQGSYFPLSAQPPEATALQQYQAPVQQPHPPSQPAPLPHYQPPTGPPPHFPQYSQPPQPAAVNPLPQLQPHLPQQPEEAMPYPPPSQTFLGICQPTPFMQPQNAPPVPYGSNPSMYEPPASRSSAAQPPLSAGYGPPPGSSFSDSFAHSASPTHWSTFAMKPMPFASSGGTSGGSSNNARLPTAQVLPQAQPVGHSQSGGGGGGGGGAGNRVPLDDVVEKVVTMGFSRDQVRATVRKLTENGQNVDLNVVLDKLMNDGDAQQQKGGWYGR